MRESLWGRITALAAGLSAAAALSTAGGAWLLARTAQQSQASADSVLKLTERSEGLLRTGQDVVGQSARSIEALGEQVRAISASMAQLSDRTLQIGHIISTVEELSEQSHLVAVNASIEAARAGEEGLGFAVVAREMRALAEQSRVAAGQVRAILSEVEKGTREAVAVTGEGSRRAAEAVALAQSVGAAMADLAQVSRESAEAARQIASGARLQTGGLEQIATAISDQAAALDDALGQTRRLEEVATAVSAVSSQLEALTRRQRV